MEKERRRGRDTEFEVVVSAQRFTVADGDVGDGALEYYKFGSNSSSRKLGALRIMRSTVLIFVYSFSNRGETQAVGKLPSVRKQSLLFYSCSLSFFKCFSASLFILQKNPFRQIGSFIEKRERRRRNQFPVREAIIENCSAHPPESSLSGPKLTFLSISYMAFSAPSSTLHVDSSRKAIVG